MKSERMIAIVGGIGSGKTFISKLFEARGIPVFNCDNCAKWIMISEHKVINELVSLFGTDIYIKGELNKEKMGNIIFLDPFKKEYIEELIYPYVFREFFEWRFEKLYKDNHSFVMMENAVLTKDNSYKLFDHVVLVNAPIKVREERVMARPGMTEKRMGNIIRQQDSPEQIIEKLYRSQIDIYTIFNNEINNMNEEVNICVDYFNGCFK